jgi:hypothetical protein
VPYELNTETASLAELMSAPEAWAVVVKHAPAFALVVKAPQVKPHLGNMTVGGFVTFGVVNPKAVIAIDEELRQLPRSQWPAL